MYFHNDFIGHSRYNHAMSGTDSNSSSEDDDSIIITNTDDGYDDADSDEHDELPGDNENVYDSIYNEDSLHFYSEKEHGKYYIGLCHTYSVSGILHWLLSTSVSSRTFLQHTYNNINNYLYCFGLVRIPQHEVQIMQVHRLTDETCTVVIKTHWLRIVQRHWKRTYAMRMNIIRMQMSAQIQYYRQIHGGYPPSIAYMPTLRGMLSKYNTNSLVERQ
jgi:hypothetical protein